MNMIGNSDSFLFNKHFILTQIFIWHFWQDFVGFISEGSYVLRILMWLFKAMDNVYEMMYQFVVDKWIVMQNKFDWKLDCATPSTEIKRLARILWHFRYLNLFANERSVFLFLSDPGVTGKMKKKQYCELMWISGYKFFPIFKFFFPGKTKMYGDGICVHVCVFNASYDVVIQK